MTKMFSNGWVNSKTWHWQTSNQYVFGLFWGVRCKTPHEIIIPKYAHLSKLYTVDDLHASTWLRQRMPISGAPCDLHVGRHTFPSHTGDPDSTLTIYVETGGPRNHLISKTHYGREWEGNIVVVQHCTSTKKPMSLHMAQIDFVDKVLMKCVFFATLRSEEAPEKPILSMPPDVFDSFNSPCFAEFVKKYNKLYVQPVPPPAPRADMVTTIITDFKDPGFRVFGCTELLEQVLYDVGILTLNVFHAVCRYGRDCVQGLMRRRMRELLRLCMPSSYIQPFLILLDYTQSAVDGSFTTCMLMWDSDWDPCDMNVFILITMKYACSPSH
ncbi:hypothetical protein EV421DRAFT_1913621 [Armillaria borealis]|uniref:Uncharacterized protein n=1 Tax=Armillaria borealis TaxID=47425 RepID=A0AA39IVI3_9AGAR|nr:hypothetical protein EV421DRAFT_1913621 [Armillaria borealis]